MICFVFQGLAGLGGYPGEVGLRGSPGERGERGEAGKPGEPGKRVTKLTKTDTIPALLLVPGTQISHLPPRASGGQGGSPHTNNLKRCLVIHSVRAPHCHKAIRCKS